jgi:hypothetical protein
VVVFLGSTFDSLFSHLLTMFQEAIITREDLLARHREPITCLCDVSSTFVMGCDSIVVLGYFNSQCSQVDDVTHCQSMGNSTVFDGSSVEHFMPPHVVNISFRRKKRLPLNFTFTGKIIALPLFQRVLM